MTNAGRAGENDADAEPQERPSRRPVATTVALFASVIALVTAAVGLVFDLWPELRPDPRTTRAADVSVLAVERAVPVGDWLRRDASRSEYGDRRKEYLSRAFAGLGEPTRAEVREALAVPGQLFYVKMRIEGFKRRSLRLRWSMYRVSGKRRLATEGLKDATGAELVGEAPSDTSVALVWTPAAVARGSLFARFELIDSGGTVLGIADSERFRGLVD
jgi:hypothetical protein